MQKNIINTNKKIEWIDVTADIERFVDEKKIKEGVVSVFVPHTTAAVTINENADPAVLRDINGHLDYLIPQSENFEHGEGNSDGHIKASLMGSAVNVPIANGKLFLGTWQSIYFCEFDGPRTRSYCISTLPSVT